MFAKNSLFWIQAGAIAGALAVGLGAFAAHGLNEFLVRKYADVTKIVAGQQIPGAVKYLADFKTAAEYQMYHALALLAVGILSMHRPSATLTLAGGAFLTGILLFSGSLYLLVLTGVKLLGAVTPFGGVAFIVGWIALCMAARGQRTVD